MSKTDKQNRLKSTVLAVALALAPMAAQAAGLGKLTVVSALGQPLRAEIELTASREEYSSLSARLASAEAFRNAGIEYAPVLSSIRFSLDKRPNGQPFLRVSSDRPLNEPFVDMLVEVNWASGRLVREYTFLLDPPDVFQKPAPAPVPVTVPEVRKEAAAPAAPAVVPAPAREPEAGTIAPRLPEPRIAAPADEKPLKKPAPVEAKPAPRMAEKPAAKPAEKPAEKPVEKAPEGGTRMVKAGDTLSKIAAETKPEGVSLDQMLVALFRTNKDVFDDGNMNRLRAGKILAIPEKDVAAGIEQGEARKIIVAQASDFNAYRKKLAAVAAAAPAREEAPKQVVTGKIAPRVEDKVPAPAAGKDKLEVSRSDAGKDGGKVTGKGRAAIEEDLIARDKAIKDANSRIAELEKNLGDLKKLAELKSTAGAKVQAQAQAAKPAAEAKKPVPAAVKPAEAPRAAEAVKPVEAPQPAEAPKPAEQAAPPAKPPAPAKPAVPPPPPPEPPSFVEENPDLVFGGGGVLALLLGYLGFKAWRKRKQAAEEAGSGIDTAAASSVFATTTGGESIDTGAAMPTDFSPDSVAGMAGDEGVDPVAEADVYIAYGRDRQAEEILLEALKTDPARRAIHLKLLEIYATRKDASRFEAVARELFALTGGSGEEWDKAVSLGLAVDPTNALYGGSAAAAEPAPAEPAAAEAADESLAAGETVVMAGALAQMAAAEPAAEAVPEAEAAPEEIPASLDFDLDLGGPAPEAAAEAPAEAAAEAPAEAPAAAADDVMSLDFDLDLGAPSAVPAEEAVPPAAEEPAVLDLDLGAPVEDAAAEAPAPAEAPAGEAAVLDFDFDLGAPPAEEEAAAPAAERPAEIAAIDLSSISLDLGEPEAAAAAPVEEAPAALSLDMPVVEVPEDMSLAVPTVEEEAELALAMPAIEMTAEAVPVAEEPPAPALEMPMIDMPAPEPVAAPEPEPVSAPEMEPVVAPEPEPVAAREPEPAIDLDMDLDMPAEAEPAIEAPAEAEPALSFDLDLPAAELPEAALVPEPEAPAAEAAPASPAEDNAEAATKLELALAYEEMGDKEGARELLTEVINEGSPAQQEAARNKLATLD